MRRLLTVAFVFAGIAAGAMCPFNIPVVTVPANDSVWYASGVNGLYMTHDAGLTWTHPLAGQVSARLVVPGTPTLVYAGTGTQLYLSRDQGAHSRPTRKYFRPLNPFPFNHFYPAPDPVHPDSAPHVSYHEIREQAAKSAENRKAGYT
jgi:hypothetical protein